jgi:phosphatidate cytidylyltransferase
MAEPIAPPPESGTPFGSEFVKRVISAVVLAPVAIGLAYVGGPLAIVAATLVSLLILWEWNDVTRDARRDVVFLAAAATITAVGLALVFDARIIAVGLAAGALLAILTTWKDQASIAWIVRGLVYALAFLVPIVLLRESKEYGAVAVFFLFAVVWATDSCAFFAGRAVGGPKLWPTVSPKKTWAGFVGGTFGGAVAAYVVARLFGVPDKLELVILAIGLSIVAHGGDLFESWVKRSFHHKDSGALIPGHGGAMDRLDGFIFAATAAMLIGLTKGGLWNVAGGLMRW